MFASRFLAQVAVPLVLVLGANAETHVIQFVNQCGYGSPALMQNGVNILTGNTYTSNGPYSGIAYLQTGYCNTNGENCTLLETTLINPTCAGCGSSTDLSLILPHYYSVTTSFAYYAGCDGQGQICTNENCVGDAFFGPNDNYVQVGCQTDNVNLLVAFCADARQIVNGTATASTASGSSSLPPGSLPTSSGSLLTNSVSTPSSSPSLGSSTPGTVPPVIPSASVTPSYSAASAPTSAPTPSVNPVPPSASASASASASPTTVENCLPRPTSLNPSSSAPMSSALPPTSPALPPTSPVLPPTTTPIPTPTFTPSTTPSTPTPTVTPSGAYSITPVTSADAATGSSDPCGNSSPSTSTTPAQRRRHRRTNRIRY